MYSKMTRMSTPIFEVNIMKKVLLVLSLVAVVTLGACTNVTDTPRTVSLSDPDAGVASYMESPKTIILTYTTLEDPKDYNQDFSIDTENNINYAQCTLSKDDSKYVLQDGAYVTKFSDSESVEPILKTFSCSGTETVDDDTIKAGTSGEIVMLHLTADDCTEYFVFHQGGKEWLHTVCYGDESVIMPAINNFIKVVGGDFSLGVETYQETNSDIDNYSTEDNISEDDTLDSFDEDPNEGEDIVNNLN